MTPRAVLLAPVVVFLAVFFLAPLFYSLAMTITNPAGPLEVYGQILSDPYHLWVLRNTFILGAAVTLACAIFGYPIAYYIARSESRWVNVVLFLVIAPLLVSIVMRSYSWVVVLGRNGLVASTLGAVGVSDTPQLLYDWPGVFIALVHVLLPYMVLSIAGVIQAIPADVEQAALTLGASPRRTFTRVTLPLSFDGIGTGSILVFMLTIGSFVTVILVGGDNTMVLSLLMYQQITYVHDNQFAAALGNILLIAAMGVLIIQSRVIRTRGLS